MTDPALRSATGRASRVRVQTAAWFDPSGRRLAILLAIIAAVANGVWLFVDNSTPSWDQSHYLDMTWRYQQALDHQGISGLVHSIYSTDPSKGPLFTVLLLPFFYVFGNGPDSALILNLVASPFLFLAAGEIAATIFRNPSARLLTIVLVATMPLMVGLDHQVLADFLLTTLVTISILLLVKSAVFQRRGVSLMLGLVMGLGTLTKVTFPLFVVGPMLVLVGHAVASNLTFRLKEGNTAFRGDFGRFATNIAGMVSVYLVVILPWYGPNFSATLAYIRSTTSGPLSAGAGPSDPYTLHAIFSFTMGMMNAHVSWIFGLAGLVALGFALPTLISWVRHPSEVAQRLVGAGILVLWVIVPYLSVALAHNQDVRLMAPAMPGMAVVLAGVMTAIRWRYVRAILIGVTVLAAVYQTASLVAPNQLGVLHYRAALRLRSQEAVIPLDKQPLGYEQLPGNDYGTPVIRYIESTVRSKARSDTLSPQTVCLLESDPIVNSNTFGYLADARGDTFSLPNITMGPQGLTGLGMALSACNFALYVKQPPVTAETAGQRLTIVNGDYAARFMTPKLFALFRGPNRTFYIGDNRYVSVLVRG